MGGTKPWPQVPIRNDDRTNAAVVIIGGGMGGMCTAIDLLRYTECRNFIILDRGNNFGGTWLDNKYPGCCCDVWSILYSFSFEQNPQWSREYPGQEEMLDYLVSVAQKWDLYKYVRFNSGVKAATWDDVSQQWKVDVEVGGGKEREYTDQYTISTDFLVSAIGQLNNPSIPDFEGRELFDGKTMHSARWDWNYDIRGKRVGIIGSGATSVQIVPEIAPLVSHLTVYQRSPSWVVTRADADVPNWRQKLYSYLPFVQSRIRASMMDLRESFHSIIRAPETSEWTAAFKKDTRAKLLATFPSESDHDQHMRETFTPNYSVGCKRILVSDDWYPAFTRPNVALETRPISRIDHNGPVVHSSSSSTTTDDKADEDAALPADQRLDLLIYATGFRTTQFLHPIHVTGAHGRPLADIWADGPHALNGVTVPDLPNFGMLYGPNTNLGHSSIVLMLEAQSRYIVGLVRAVLQGRRHARNHPDARTGDTRVASPASLVTLTPKRHVVQAYEAEMQSRLASSPWADPGCSSWYKDRVTGKITNNWPGDCREYMDRLSVVRWSEYEGGAQVGRMRTGEKETRVGRVWEETVIGDRTAVTLLGVASAGAVAGSLAWRMLARRR